MEGVRTFDVEVLDKLLFLLGRVFTRRFHVDESPSTPTSLKTQGVDHVTGHPHFFLFLEADLAFLTRMQTLHRNAGIPRLALIVAGRRVVQPFYARTLRVSLPSRADPIPDAPHPPTPANHHNATSPEPCLPKQPKKKSKTPPPSPKPKGKKPSTVARKKSKPVQIITRDSKRVRKGVSVAREPHERGLDGSGLMLDNWGKDGASLYWTFECDLNHYEELAPPPPTKSRTASKLRPRKEIVQAGSSPSSSSRALPPHRIPYVRRTEGYISDEADQCNDVLRGVSRVWSR